MEAGGRWAIGMTAIAIANDGALGAALVEHVRRVVFDSRGVVVDMGSKSRLFTGTAREAAILARAVCTWPAATDRRMTVRSITPSNGAAVGPPIRPTLPRCANPATFSNRTTTSPSPSETTAGQRMIDA